MQSMKKLYLKDFRPKTGIFHKRDSVLRSAKTTKISPMASQKGLKEIFSNKDLKQVLNSTGS